MGLEDWKAPPKELVLANKIETCYFDMSATKKWIDDQTKKVISQRKAEKEFPNQFGYLRWRVKK